MAAVCLAEDLKHNRKVAIKVLHPELTASVGGPKVAGEKDESPSAIRRTPA
jgi:hypothetical protein